MKLNNLIILFFLSLLGCRNENQVRQLLDKEIHLPVLYKNCKDDSIVTFYIDVNRYIMLDYNFYVEVVNNSTYFAMVFCEFNNQSYHCAEDAIVLELSDSPDSIYYNFKSNLFKLRSYIQNSPYFNQNCKLKNKINILQYIVRQIIYYLEKSISRKNNYCITYADCKRMREIKLTDTEIKSDTINYTFYSGSTKKYYSLSLIISNEWIKDLLIK